MKIILIGYGKMGRTIEQIAERRNHEVVAKVDFDNMEDLNESSALRADVAIEFTRPESAVDNLKKCLSLGLPVVCGTTGWGKEEAEIVRLFTEEQGALFYASNYSIGVNIFFAVSRYLASLMNQADAYEVRLEEIHHTQKLDAPSGTAITMAGDLIKMLDRKKEWTNSAETNSGQIPIVSKRMGVFPGTHIATYSSTVDDIEIKHTAHSRDGFAEGAVKAAEWLAGKKGVFGMKDLLGF